MDLIEGPRHRPSVMMVEPGCSSEPGGRTCREIGVKNVTIYREVDAALKAQEATGKELDLVLYGAQRAGIQPSQLAPKK